MKDKKNNLSYAQKRWYKERFARNISYREKQGIKYSKEFINTIKNIPYENIKEDKIRELHIYSDIIIGDVNKIGTETEKYYLQLINAIIKADNNIPLEGIDNVFINIFENIQFMYDNLDKTLFDKIINLYCTNIGNEKRKVINSIFKLNKNQIKNNMAYLNKIVNCLTILNDDFDDIKIQSLKMIIDNLEKFPDSELAFSKYKIKILEMISSSYCVSSINLNEFLKNILHYDLKNYELFLFLLNLNGNDENEYAQYFWNEMINDKKFMTLNDFEFQNKVIEFSKKQEFDDKNYKTKTIANIIKLLSDFTNKKIRDNILNKLVEIKNIKSLLLLEKMTPILIEFSNEKSVENIVNSIEDENGVLSKRLIIDLANKR